MYDEKWSPMGDNASGPYPPHSHVKEIAKDTLFENACTSAILAPKTATELHLEVEDAGHKWTINNMYSRILGIWVREE